MRPSLSHAVKLQAHELTREDFANSQVSMLLHSSSSSLLV